MKRKPFADKYESNANFQIKRLNDAINRYGGSVDKKAKLYRYVSGNKLLGLMQPRALKPFADIVCRCLEKKILPNNKASYHMFTLVMGDNFGKNNWQMKCDDLQKKTQKLLKGYNYIARICLDEFPRAKYLDEGVLMSLHVHGIFFQEPSRWHAQKINQNIKLKGYKITPLLTRHFDRLIDAVHYMLKMPFGGKIRYKKKDGMTASRHVSLYLNATYSTFMNLKDVKIYDFMFAGGKGKKVLRQILAEVKNEKA